MAAIAACITFSARVAVSLSCLETLKWLSALPILMQELFWW